MAFTHYFWHRQPAIDAALLKHFADFIGPDKLVVDVGAGYDPWPYATEFVDCEIWPQLQGKPVRVLDVELDRLPYADKEVDFIYCRHTIEDLHNPTQLLREMNRIAKAGYIETPSPTAEVNREVQSGPLRGRGYAHHHWIAWECSGVLTLLPKLPAIELAMIAEPAEAQMTSSLRELPILWNTYFPWRGELRFYVLKNHVDFDAMSTYARLLDQGLAAAFDNAYKFTTDFELQGAALVGTPAQPQKNQQ